MQQNMRPITNPDFNQEFARWQHILSTAPDNELKHYLLSGDPVAKLAAASVQDQKIKSQAQAQPVAQAPAQSVLAQKADMIQPGVASLPVGQGMFNENSYAGGGIIAFDEGGMLDEQSYAGGGIVSFTQGGDVPSFAGPKGSFVSDVLTPEQWSGLTFAQKMAYQGPNKEELYKLDKINYPSLPKPQVSLDPNNLFATSESYFAQQAPQVKPADSTVTGKKDASALTQKDTAEVGKSGVPAEQPATDPTKMYIPGARRDLLSAFSTADEQLSKAEKYGGKYQKEQEAGLASLKTKAERGPMSSEDAMKEAGKAYVGEPQAEYKSYLEKKLAGMGNEKDNAKWTAALMAGLGIAGGQSQYALSNIAQGATKGAEYYLSRVDKLEVIEEQRRKGLADIAQAKRLEQQGQYRDARRLIERGEDRQDSAQDKYASVVSHMNDSDKQTMTSILSAKASLGAQEGKALTDLAMDSAKLAQSAAQHTQTIQMYDKRIAASGGVAHARLVETKRKAYLDAQTTLGPEIANILKKKYNGNSEDPMFQREKDLMLKGYVANALSLTLDDMDARDSGSL